MKILYLDCFSGISGDMVVGALLDAGLDFGLLKRQLSKLNLNGYEVNKKFVMRNGIKGVKFEVSCKKNLHSHASLKQLCTLINKSRLNKEIKKDACLVFKNLAKAEGYVHGKRITDARLHEVAQTDSIIDIISICIGFYELGIDRVYSSPIRLGGGFVKTAHGILPLPAPAALNLLYSMKVFFSDIKKELVTPTGAAILKTFSKPVDKLPVMKIINIGYGAGDNRMRQIPNLLRVVIGEV